MILETYEDGLDSERTWKLHIHIYILFSNDLHGKNRVEFTVSVASFKSSSVQHDVHFLKYSVLFTVE